MNGAFVVVAAVALLSQDSATLLAEGRFGEALEAAREAEGLAGARATADVLFAGRDFAGVVRVCEEALEAAPTDAWLLWRAAGASLWLRDGVRARDFCERLLTAADDEPDASLADFWRTQAASFDERAGALIDGRERRRTAVRRARWVTGSWGAGILLGVTVLGRRRD